MKQITGLFLLSFVFGFAQSVAPLSKPVPFGQGAVLNLASVDGSTPQTFQWAKDGNDIPGATAKTLTISAVSLADVGTYTLTVSNAAGKTVSNAAVLIVTIVNGKMLISFGPNS